MEMGVEKMKRSSPRRGRGSFLREGSIELEGSSGTMAGQMRSFVGHRPLAGGARGGQLQSRLQRRPLHPLLQQR